MLVRSAHSHQEKRTVISIQAAHVDERFGCAHQQRHK